MPAYASILPAYLRNWDSGVRADPVGDLALLNLDTRAALDDARWTTRVGWTVDFDVESARDRDGIVGVRIFLAALEFDEEETVR